MSRLDPTTEADALVVAAILTGAAFVIVATLFAGTLVFFHDLIAGSTLAVSTVTAGAAAALATALLSGWSVYVPHLSSIGRLGCRLSWFAEWCSRAAGTLSSLRGDPQRGEVAERTKALAC